MGDEEREVEKTDLKLLMKYASVFWYLYSFGKIMWFMLIADFLLCLLFIPTEVYPVLLVNMTMFLLAQLWQSYVGGRMLPSSEEFLESTLKHGTRTFLVYETMLSMRKSGKLLKFDYKKAVSLLTYAELGYHLKRFSEPARDNYVNVVMSLLGMR